MKLGDLNPSNWDVKGAYNEARKMTPGGLWEKTKQVGTYLNPYTAQQKLLGAIADHYRPEEPRPPAMPAPYRGVRAGTPGMQKSFAPQAIDPWSFSTTPQQLAVRARPIPEQARSGTLSHYAEMAKPRFLSRFRDNRRG